MSAALIYQMQFSMQMGEIETDANFLIPVWTRINFKKIPSLKNALNGSQLDFENGH